MTEMLDIHHDGLVSALRSASSGTTFRFFPKGSADRHLPFKILSMPQSGTTDSLILVFHGAMGQAKYGYPAFTGAALSKIEGTCVVAFADPTQQLSPDINIAWYAGDEGFDTRKHIDTLIGALKDALNPTRIVTTGGSGGAHPALVYGVDAGADAIVLQNPLFHISRYYRPEVKRYLKYAWPGADILPDDRVVDLAADVYAEAPDKPALIILQNATDSHLAGKILPSLANLGNGGDVLFLSNYFSETMGHSYPTDEWVSWVRAAALAPEPTTASILESKPRVQPSTPPSVGAATRTGVKHAYSDLPARAFWRRAVSDLHFSEITDVAEPIDLSLEDKIATAGSCFAQHIGRHLRAWGGGYLDLEPVPSSVTDIEEARRHGYATYSCRYGNIYTATQLLQLFQEAFHERAPQGAIWEKDGRYYDACRQLVDPDGQATPEDVSRSRDLHLEAVRKMFTSLDVFVFTLGLTEAWEGSDGTVYGTAPGVIAGRGDGSVRFRNFTYPEVFAALEKFRSGLRSVNSDARILLTVSPVPLVATASGHHVLPATVYSKSVLRAVAGDMASRYQDVSYFPSYEIISNHYNRGAYFESDLRSVSKIGVEHVMAHLKTALRGKSANSRADQPDHDGIVCDEEEIVR